MASSSKPFLITGLPRCRTAWMAAVATTKQSVCQHEPLKAMQRWQDVFALWNRGGSEFVGVSDSAMGFHLGEILDRAAPRTLIIDRPVDQVEASLRKAGFPAVTGYCQLLAKRLDAFRTHPLVATVQFDLLGDVDVVERSLRHLMPSAYIDLDRVDAMMDRVIQADPYEVMVSAKQRAGDIVALLGEDVIAELRAQ